jgi:integrase
VGTGLRRGELLNLRWADVDLQAGRLVVRNREGFTSKNGRERLVPVVGRALETLREMYGARDPLDNERVFVDGDGKPPKPDRVSRRFKFYVRKAKLPNADRLSFHSCRHTFCSWLSMKDVPIRKISELAGHSSTAVTEVYSHLQPESLERAMNETFGHGAG